MSLGAIGGNGTDLISLIEEMRAAMIERLDRNGDGALDESELGAVTEKFSLQKPSDLISKFDQNQDGVLDANEVLEAIEMLDGDRINRAQRIIFGQMDLNGDGAIDEDELSEAMEQAEQKLSGVVDAYDTNRDGVLSAEEIEDMLSGMVRPPPPPPSGSADPVLESGNSGEDVLTVA